MSDGGRCCIAFECKANSFGPGTSQATQARTLLLLTGKVISDFFGLDVGDSLLVFLTVNDVVSLQEDCLTELAEECRAAGCETSKWQVWGLAKKDDGVYIRNIGLTLSAAVETLDVERQASAASALQAASMNYEVRVVKTSDPDRYELLRLIPLDPSVNLKDRVGLEVLQERLRSALAESILRQLHSRSKVTVSIEALCNKIVMYVWPYWSSNSQKAMRGLVRESLLNVFRRFEKLGVTATREADAYVLVFPSEKSRRHLTRYLLSSEYRKHKFMRESAQCTLPLEELER
ncbi:MAG TPA: hypothetical protein GXX40_01620 [Firmicutes bacterium]|nr:hypothetical protein [Bacillota bacterium]